MSPLRLPRFLLNFSLALLLSCGLGLSLAPGMLGQTLDSPQVLAQSGREHYQIGDYERAERDLKQALQGYQASQNPAGQAMVLSNLALVLGQQGDWAIAQSYLDQSLEQLQNQTEPNQAFILAQVLNVQGRLQFAQGQAHEAAQSWGQSAMAYKTAGQIPGEIRSRLREAQAIQALGFYDQAAREVLIPLKQELDRLPDSELKAAGLLQWGESLVTIGQLRDAQASFRESLDVAQRIDSPTALAAGQLNLANSLYAEVIDGYRRGRLKRREANRLEQLQNEAIALYEDLEDQSLSTSPSPSTVANVLRARLSHLQLLLDTTPWQLAAPDAALDPIPHLLNILEQVQAVDQGLAWLPPSQSTFAIRTNFASQLLKLELELADLAQHSPSYRTALEQQRQSIPDSEALLSTTVQWSEAAGDHRSQAYALGLWGQAAAQHGDLRQGLKLTDKATLLAKRVNAPESLYRWYEQRGQLLEAVDDRAGAIAAYSSAVETLKTLRRDLITVNPEVLFSFQKEAEPTYRQLMTLLLEEAGAQPSQAALGKVRRLVESLQQDELTDYLQADCLQVNRKVDLEELESIKATAFIYPIILPNQLAIILSLPSLAGSSPAGGNAPRELQLYSSTVDQFELEDNIQSLRQGLRKRHSLGFQIEAQQIYDWLIRPLQGTLQSNNIQTLVFVMDGALRNLPPAVLFDGQQYLLEQYALATTPGLQHTAPQSLQTQTLSTLAFGLTEAKGITLPENCGVEAQENCQQIEFAALPAVEPELAQIATEVEATQVVLNDDFQRQTFQTEVGQSDAPIVHLATHGQFSSAREETFVLASDGIIGVEQFAEVLKTRTAGGRSPIELLVLSACETASGDDRAALGLAGLALRSGARSTVASLWPVSDEATALMMQRFYKELSSQQVTKAEALRRAQQQVLEDPLSRRHPYFWAPFILVGNWL